VEDSRQDILLRGENALYTILLVIHDRLRVNLLQPVLIASRYAVLVVRDGRQALAQIAQQSPNLVIIERDLPDTNGLVLCQQIHARLDIPIVIIAFSATINDIVAGLDCGADDVLSSASTPSEDRPCARDPPTNHSPKREVKWS
jgi:DNA-binding response OmpR family regulator